MKWKKLFPLIGLSMLLVQPACSDRDVQKKPAIAINALSFPQANILDRGINPESDEYIAGILEIHMGMGSREANKNQPALYEAGTLLVENGFRIIYTESWPTEFGINEALLGDTVDYSEILDLSTSRERKDLITTRFLGQEIQTSFLLALTYPHTTLRGAETFDAIERLMEHNQVFNYVVDEIESGSLERMQKRYQTTQEESVKKYLQGMNDGIDYLMNAYPWWMNGRSYEMVSNVLRKDNDGVLFLGQNHYESLREALKARHANYILICAPSCTRESAVKEEQETRKIFQDLANYKTLLK